MKIINIINFYCIVGITCICFACEQKIKAVATGNLELKKSKFGRNLINKDGNPTIATIQKGDTFDILEVNEDAETDFFLYYKVKTKNNIKGFLFGEDSLTY